MNLYMIEVTYIQDDEVRVTYVRKQAENIFYAIDFAEQKLKSWGITDVIGLNVIDKRYEYE